MTLSELRQKLQLLESQRISLDNEIIQTKREIEKLSPFSKEQKIELFKSLFIGYRPTKGFFFQQYLKVA